MRPVKGETGALTAVPSVLGKDYIGHLAVRRLAVDYPLSRPFGPTTAVSGLTHAAMRGGNALADRLTTTHAN